MNPNTNSWVCVVSPVYNGETYIARFLESMLAQSYRPLRLVLVNDGSVDRTLDVVNTFRQRLSDAGVDFVCLSQANAGQASAMALGLQSADGDYLIWPDTDDFLFPDSIEKRVRFLEANLQYGFVVSDGVQYEENDLKQPCGAVKPQIPVNGDVRKYALSGCIFQSPSIMARMDCFASANPQKYIYPTRNGQNVQMLLPLALSAKCGHINEPLYGRVLRGASHSRSFGSSPQEKESRARDLFHTVVATLFTVEHTRPWHYVYASLAYCETCWRQKFNGAQSNGEGTWYSLWQVQKKLTYSFCRLLKDHVRRCMRRRDPIANLKSTVARRHG